MLADIREGDVYAAPMKRCIGFFANSGQSEKALSLLDKYCDADSGIYDNGELKTLRARLDKAARREASVAADADGWKSISKATALSGKGCYGDAAKLLHSVVSRHSGEVKAAALLNLAKCQRAMHKFQMAVDALDALMPEAGEDLKLTALKLKVAIQLTDLHDPSAARKSCENVLKKLNKDASSYRLVAGEIEILAAMCDFASGIV